MEYMAGWGRGPDSPPKAVHGVVDTAASSSARDESVPRSPKAWPNSQKSSDSGSFLEADRGSKSLDRLSGELEYQYRRQLEAHPPPHQELEVPKHLKPVFKGYLNKQGKSMLIKRWQRRYFVLYPGVLMYWVDERDFLSKKKAKGIVDLSECSLVTAEQHTKRPESFGLFHQERRDYFLEAPSSALLREWVRHIEVMLGVDEESVSMQDFELLNVVGKGAYGKVVQVRKKDTGTIYAMKMIAKESFKKKKEGAAGREDMERFKTVLASRESLRGIINVEKAAYKHWMVESLKAERRVLEVVNHPFIVKLHYAFQTCDKLCLVLDFINGGELFSYINKEKVFSEERTRFYTVQLILALEYLHEMDIIYRDLKPENILLDKDGHIRLTDFGHSKDEHSRDDRAFSMVGSPYYMAPEILLNKGHGSEVDWWSLGILVYEMLVGLPPFYQENTRKAYEMLLTRPIEFPDHVSTTARQMISALLDVDSTKRLGRGQVDRSRGDDLMALAAKWHVPWLRSVEWRRMLLKEVEPPFKPKVKSTEDISNFAHHFTSEVVSNMRSLASTTSLAGNQCDIFSDFSYVAPPSRNLANVLPNSPFSGPARSPSLKRSSDASIEMEGGGGGGGGGGGAEGGGERESNNFASTASSSLPPLHTIFDAPERGGGGGEGGGGGGGGGGDGRGGEGGEREVPPALVLPCSASTHAQSAPARTLSGGERMESGRAKQSFIRVASADKKQQGKYDTSSCERLSQHTPARIQSWEESDSESFIGGASSGIGVASHSKMPVPSIKYSSHTTGRHVLASPMPRSMSDGLARLDERNKALKSLLHKQYWEEREGDSMLGPAAVGATDLLAECNWDMTTAVNAMLDAIHRRDEIEECFTSKGDTPVSREVERVQQMTQALDYVLSELHNKSDPSLLQRQNEETETAPRQVLGKASSTDHLDRGMSSAGSSCISLSKALSSDDDEDSRVGRSRLSSTRSVDAKLLIFESEAADVFRKAAAKKALADTQRLRLRCGDVSHSPSSPVPPDA